MVEKSTPSSSRLPGPTFCLCNPYSSVPPLLRWHSSQSNLGSPCFPRTHAHSSRKGLGPSLCAQLWDRKKNRARPPTPSQAPTIFTFSCCLWVFLSPPSSCLSKFHLRDREKGLCLSTTLKTEAIISACLLPFCPLSCYPVLFFSTAFSSAGPFENICLFVDSSPPEYIGLWK